MYTALNVPLTGGDLDRADALRRDQAAVDRLRADPACRLLAFHEGRPAISLAGEAGLALAQPSEAFFAADPDPVFLGFTAPGGAQGAPRFAVDLTGMEEEQALALWPQAQWPEPPKFIDLRSISPDLSASETGMAAQARSALEWRRTHQFCARCGQGTVQALAGWRRDCKSCGGQHFPRTDPVVIMLVAGRDPQTGEERVVLGRQANWPAGRFSLLAGFVEPGESIEAAVRRETMEEAGIEVGRVGYLASQPWPFPSCLMIGCYAEALGDALTPDYHELEACDWFTKTKVRDALAGRIEEMSPPRSDAIAWSLLSAWAEDRLPAGF